MRKSAGALALALVVCSCREPPEVTYKLVATQLGPLPILLDTAGHCYHMLQQGDVRITGSRYVSTFTIDKACPGRGIEPVPAGAAGEFETVHDSLIFHDSAGGVTGRGILRADTLAVQGPLHRLIYIRQ